MGSFEDFAQQKQQREQAALETQREEKEWRRKYGRS